MQVLDARDPAGCRCPDVERYVRSLDPNKRVILLLNKMGERLLCFELGEGVGGARVGLLDAGLVGERVAYVRQGSFATDELLTQSILAMWGSPLRYVCTRTHGSVLTAKRVREMDLDQCPAAMVWFHAADLVPREVCEAWPK